MTTFTRKKDFNSDIQIIEVFLEDAKIFEYTGLFKMIYLDEYSIAIIQIPKDKSEQRKVTFITATDDKYNINTFNIPFNQTIALTNGLYKNKKFIVPIDNRFAVFSYEFGIISSALYDHIIYDDINKEFFVYYILKTPFGELTLSGTLDTEGHLKNDCLYSRYLNEFFYVDEFNLDYSINQILPKIARQIRKKDSKLIEPKIISFKRTLKKK